MPDTYDFQDQVRDVTPVVNVIVKDSPTLLSLIGDSPYPVINTKHEYLEDALNSYRDPVGATFATGATSLTVTDGTKFRKNDIVGFEAATGEAYLETVRVTDINGNVLTVTRQYNGQAKVQVEAADIAKVVQRPNVENTVGGIDEAHDRTPKHNFTEIFIKYATVSRTQQQVKTHGVGDELNYQVNMRLMEKVLQYERALLFGTKNAGSKTQPRTCGGIITEILQSGTALKKDVNGALAATDLDDAVEDIVTNSGVVPNTIVCHPTLSRKISALDVNGVRIDRGDPTTGRAVFSFRSAVPVAGLQFIVVNNQMPKDMALVCNTMKMFKAWLQRPFDQDATQKGQDGFARKITSELTYEFPNSDECHKLLYNITLS